MSLRNYSSRLKVNPGMLLRVRSSSGRLGYSMCCCCCCHILPNMTLAGLTVIHRLHIDGSIGPCFCFYSPMPAESGLGRKVRPVDWTGNTDKGIRGIFYLWHDAVRIVRFAKLLKKCLWRIEPWLIWLPVLVRAWRSTWRIAEVVGYHVATRIGYS